MPTQNVSFWHVNYFELKAIKTNFISYLTAQNNFDKGPVPGKELLPEIIFCIKKTYLYGMASICLPNIYSSHLPVNCFHLL